MPTMQEVRAKFPQYNDMPDKDLTDALHTKYYSDMPKDQYYKSVGFVPKPASAPVEEKPKNSDVPAWGARNPNLYGVYGAGRELLRAGIETAGTTAGEALGALTPVPGAAYVGGGAGYAGSKRAAQKLLGEPVDWSGRSLATDVAVGATQAGVGKLIGLLPGVKRVLSPEMANVGTASQDVVGKKLIDKTAYSIMEKSMKVPPSVRQPIREKAINAALNEGIPITKGGLKRTQGLLSDLTDKMDEAVLNSANRNAPIQTDSVLAPVQELRDWVGKTVNGDKLVGKIDGVVKNFKKQYGDVITVGQAQEIKQNTNALLSKMYGQLQPVTVETQKQIVRGLKDRIATEIPEITGVNAKYSDLKTLETALERAVNRTGNWDWLSLSSGLVGGVVGGTTGKVTSAAEAAALWRMLKSPAVQSNLAILIKNTGTKSEANVMANAVANTIYHKLTDNIGGAQ